MSRNCKQCDDLGYIRVKLPPNHKLFGKAIACPTCGRQAHQQQISKRWPVTASEGAFGLTPYGSRNNSTVVLAWKSANAFLRAKGARFLALYGHAGSGKSHLLLVLRHLAESNNFSTIYTKAVEMQSRIQQFENDVKRVQDWHDMSTVDFLIIDEFDDFTGEKIKPKLRGLFNARIAKGLPTACAFNDYRHLPQTIISRLMCYADWAPAGPKGKSGWIDMTSVPDGRGSFGIAPRAVRGKK